MELNMALFGSQRYSKLSLPAKGERKMVIPDGSWIKCKNCSQTLYADRLEDNHQVCWYCGHHLAMTAEQRIKLVTDKDSFVEMVQT